MLRYVGHCLSLNLTAKGYLYDFANYWHCLIRKSRIDVHYFVGKQEEESVHCYCAHYTWLDLPSHEAVGVAYSRWVEDLVEADNRLG